MNVLKKIASYLFEEEELDDDVIVEDELKPVVFANEQKEEVVKKELPKVTNYESQKKVIEENKEMTSSHQFGSITLDGPKKEGIKRKTLERNPKQEYEMSPVISPMYGTGKVDKNSVSKKVISVKKNNPLGTVISPMYGSTELEKMEEKAVIELEKKEEKHTNIVEEVLVDIPLDQMLVKDEPIESDDVLQFSLFGEDEVVKHANQLSIMNEDGKKA